MIGQTISHFNEVTQTDDGQDLVFIGRKQKMILRC